MRGAAENAALAKDAFGGVQSVVRAFRILDHIADHQGGLALGRLAQLTELPRSTVHRLLTTMESLGHVEFDSRAGAWFIGSRSLKIGEAYLASRDLERASRSTLRSLAVRAGLPANLAIRAGGGVQYLTRALPGARGGWRPRANGGGLTFPVTRSASGRAMLTSTPAQELAALAANDARPIAGAEACEALLRTLERVSVLGYAVDDEECLRGVRCVAAPIHGDDGQPVAAISVSGATDRLVAARVAELGDDLARAAHRISNRMAGSYAG